MLLRMKNEEPRCLVRLIGDGRVELVDVDGSRFLEAQCVDGAWEMETCPVVAEPSTRLEPADDLLALLAMLGQLILRRIVGS
jgi:hypothetical protein